MNLKSCSAHLYEKIVIATGIIFITVFSLTLATNVIHWDETPLEQSVAALPLGLGFLFELPFLFISAMLTGNGSENGLISYQWHSIMLQLIPLLAAAFYSGLFYLVVTKYRLHRNNALQVQDEGK